MPSRVAPHALALNNAGSTNLNGAVTGLTTLTTDAAGTTNIGANITSSGAQNYNDAVVLTASDILTTTSSGLVNFANTVNGAFGLTIAAGTGTVGFNSTVGNTAALTSLSSTGTGAVTFTGAVGSSTQLLGSGRHHRRIQY